MTPMAPVGDFMKYVIYVLEYLLYWGLVALGLFLLVSARIVRKWRRRK